MGSYVAGNSLLRLTPIDPFKPCLQRNSRPAGNKAGEAALDDCIFIQYHGCICAASKLVHAQDVGSANATPMQPAQTSLFAKADAAVPIPGLHYELDFLSREQEADLLEVIRSLPLHAAKYKEYLARRQVVSFGGSYDFDTHTLRPGPALDERLVPLRDRVADWLGTERMALVQVLIAQYAPGTPLGWHRDVPDFEIIAGVSLGNPALLKFRPYPPDEVAKRNVVQMEVAPRSIYKMEGAARWGWQHCVPPVKATRWSITFRTARRHQATRAHPIV